MARFLVIQLARFGDLVQTKRLVRSLEARGEVHLCLDCSLVGVAKLVFPKAIVHPLPVHVVPNSEGLDQLRRGMAALAAQSFDLVYNLNHAGINRALVRLFDPEQVRGHSMHGDQPFRSPWVRMAFRWTRSRPVAPVNLVDFWAFLDHTPCPAHRVNPVAAGQGRGLGVVLAGRESRRSLPPPLLAQISRTAFEALGGVPVYLFGSTGEKVLARQLIRHLPGHMLDRVVDLCGKTSWQGLADALVGLDALITPDTGTMHLAAHLGVPVQAFFLSSAWCHETGPYGEGHKVWQSVYECAPCLESAPCPIHVACLEGFSHEALTRALALSLRSEGKSLSAHKALPASLCCQHSLLDALGGTWHTVLGHDPHEAARTALRAQVAEYLGLHTQTVQGEGHPLLYDEADWMLFAPRMMKVLEDLS